jgi:RND family efflux transporter MFP subunit
LGGAVCLAALGIASRVRDRSALRDRTLQAAVPVVSVVTPTRSESAFEILLPGNVQAFTEAPIYARTSGYLKAWRVDIGGVVRKGQKLADIESPEVDQQLYQARASLGTAKANEDLAAITANRLKPLVDTMAISRQEYDNAVGALAARKAETEAAAANVRRLEELVSFETIEAPFDGVITARNTDVGQLVDAGSGAPARELFRIASTDVLRLFVQVPEANSGYASPGTSVDVTLAEHPGKQYEGRIARTAGAIDPATRTLRIEVDLANKSGEILPGAFAQVHLRFPTETRPLTVPVSALLFRSEGPRIATVDSSNHAVLVPVQLGRDYGTQIEIASGLSPDSRVIDSPPDSLLDGQEVRIAVRTPAPGTTPAVQPSKERAAR